MAATSGMFHVLPDTPSIIRDFPKTEMINSRTTISDFNKAASNYEHERQFLSICYRPLYSLIQDPESLVALHPFEWALKFGNYELAHHLIDATHKGIDPYLRVTCHHSKTFMQVIATVKLPKEDESQRYSLASKVIGYEGSVNDCGFFIISTHQVSGKMDEISSQVPLCGALQCRNVAFAHWLLHNNAGIPNSLKDLTLSNGSGLEKKNSYQLERLFNKDCKDPSIGTDIRNCVLTANKLTPAMIELLTRAEDGEPLSLQELAGRVVKENHQQETQKDRYNLLPFHIREWLGNLQLPYRID